MPGAQDFFDILARNQNTPTAGPNVINRKATSMADGGAQPAVQLTNAFQSGGRYATDLGIASLTDLLFRRGATDPQRLNSQLSSIDRGAQVAADGVAARAARAGMSGFGGSLATQAATLNAGNRLRSDAIGQENALQEQRQFMTLDALINMIFNPSMDLANLGIGQALGNKQSKNAKLGAATAMLGAAAGGGGSLLGNLTKPKP